MAASSVRDLQVKDDDLVAGTHGRGIWILDDITPLRQIGRSEETVLYKPGTAWRMRWNTNTDTPLPPDEVRAPNPPEGGIIDYYLASDAPGPVSLEITDAAGKLVRHYSSADPPEHPLPDPATDAPLPLYWYRKPQTVSAAGGMHRFTWDLHYQPIPGVGGGRGGGGLPISAVPYDTVPAPTTPWVAPGTYTVKLTANGKMYSQPIVVKQDPRVKTPALAMQQVYTLSKATYYETLAAAAALDAARKTNNQDEVKSLSDVLAQLGGVLNILQAADVPATAVQLKAIADARQKAAAALAKSKLPQ
jgi:hypothetical protein